MQKRGQRLTDAFGATFEICKRLGEDTISVQHSPTSGFKSKRLIPSFFRVSGDTQIPISLRLETLSGSRKSIWNALEVH